MLHQDLPEPTSRCWLIKLIVETHSQQECHLLWHLSYNWSTTCKKRKKIRLDVNSVFQERHIKLSKLGWKRTVERNQQMWSLDFYSTRRTCRTCSWFGDLCMWQWQSWTAKRNSSTSLFLLCRITKRGKREKTEMNAPIFLCLFKTALWLQVWQK